MIKMLKIKICYIKKTDKFKIIKNEMYNIYGLLIVLI